jgi:hypothetical protein
MFSEWVKVCKANGFSYRIESGRFLLGVSWTKANGSESGIDWIRIQSTSQLYRELGY